MRPRGLALLSMLLYALACALPALTQRRPPVGVEQAPTMGWECLVWGLCFFYMILPLLFWIVNPWLWTLWVRALWGLPSRQMAPWAAVAYAGMVLFSIYFMYEMRPLVGAGLWFGSIALGAEAARQATPEERRPTS